MLASVKSELKGKGPKKPAPASNGWAAEAEPSGQQENTWGA
jgi:hypothetical protein